MKGKKMLSSIALAVTCLLLVSGARATWVYLFSGSATSITVDSDVPIEFSYTITPDTITDVSVTQNVSETISLVNNDGNQSLDLTYSVNITDVSDSCDNTDDIEVTVLYDGTPKTSGSTIALNSGETKEVEVETQIIKDSCPQTVEVTMDIVPI